MDDERWMPTVRSTLQNFRRLKKLVFILEPEFDQFTRRKIFEDLLVVANDRIIKWFLLERDERFITCAIPETKIVQHKHKYLVKV